MLEQSGVETFSSLTICLLSGVELQQSKPLGFLFVIFADVKSVVDNICHLLKSFGLGNKQGVGVDAQSGGIGFLYKKIWHVLKWQQLRKSRSYWGCKEFTSLRLTRAVQMSLLFSQVVINAFQSL